MIGQLLLCLLGIQLVSAAPHYPLLTADRVPWDFPLAKGERVVAIGDLHGDFEALLTILRNRKLIDDAGDWIGGGAHLVLMGDLNDRGPATRAMLDFLRKLTIQAKTAGGHVHTLLGNHEVMVLTGRNEYVSRGEAWSFREFLTSTEMADLKDGGQVGHGVTRALRGPSPYAEELRQRNSLLKIGDTLFVHAGLEVWAATTEPGAINSTIRRWVEYFQGRGPIPPADTSWVLGFSGPRSTHNPGTMAQGPLWTAVFSLDDQENRGVRLKQLAQWLKAWGVNRVVVGHIQALNGIAPIPHPIYGDMVWMIDTGLSAHYFDPPSTLAALEVKGAEPKMHYIKRSTGQTIRKPCERILTP